MKQVVILQYILNRLDLAPYIRELVMLNECVILPDFGGFETQYKAAFYDKTKKQMLPPTKKVHFRVDYNKGGEVLQKHLCLRLGINDENADLLITNYVNGLNEKLEEYGEVIISGVGHFSAGVSGELVFEHFDEENYLVDSYGLEKLPFKKMEKERSKSIENELKLRPRSNTMMFVVTGILTIGVLFTITVFFASHFDLYLFNIGDEKSSGDLIIIGESVISDTLHKKIDAQISASTNTKKALYYTERNKNSYSKKENSYYIVAGSFKTLKNAEATEKEFIVEGYMPSIIENQGYHRVVIGAYSDKEEALKELQRFRRQLNRSLWLLTMD